MSASAPTPDLAIPSVTPIAATDTNSSEESATVKQTGAWTHEYEGAICQLVPNGPVTTDSIVRYPKNNDTTSEGKTEWRHDAKEEGHRVITKIYGPGRKSSVSEEILKDGITDDELLELKIKDSLLADLASHGQQDKSILTLLKVDTMDGRGFEGFQFHLTNDAASAEQFRARTSGTKMSCTWGKLMKAFASPDHWEAPTEVAVPISEEK